MSEPAIRVENLSKAYRIGLKEEVPDTLTSALLGWVRRPLRNFHRLKRLNTFNANGDGAPDDTIWALKDVSFDVAEGEVVGIIGRNGAGKSTLLKILSRITEPTSGRAVIRGRVSSLLEVGTGFHPELSGRENIYMNGTILGMTKREIDRKFDEIVDFSGVEKFLDTPIKRYSSGMQVRLAFSVAAHLEPEILIIDEVLAVGDVEFQNKCLGKMQDVARGGRTVLFVSHNMAAVQALCTRAILINQGLLQQAGKTGDVINAYLQESLSLDADRDLSNHAGRNTRFQKSMQRVRLSSGGELADSIPAKGGMAIDVDFVVDGPPFQPILGVVVRDCTGMPLFGINNRLLPGKENSQLVSRGTIRCTLPCLSLMPGRYKVDLYLGDAHGDFDVVMNATEFEITSANIFRNGKFPPQGTGPFLQDATFECIESGALEAYK